MGPFSPSTTAMRFHAREGTLATTSETRRAVGAPWASAGWLLRFLHLGSLGPHTGGGRNRQHVEPTMRLDRFPSAGRVAIDLISGDPSHRHPLLPSMHQHRESLLRLGRKANLLWNPRFCPALFVPHPLFWQVQLPIQKHMSPFGRVAQDRRHLSIFQLACCSQILAWHSHRVRSLFEKARLIDHSYPLLVCKGLDDKLLQSVACGIGIPRHSVQQPVHAIRDAIPYRFGDLPTVLALRLRQEPTQIFLRLFARLTALKQVGKPCVKLLNFLLPRF